MVRPTGSRVFLLEGLAKLGFLNGLAKPWFGPGLLVLWSLGPLVPGPRPGALVPGLVLLLDVWVFPGPAPRSLFPVPCPLVRWPIVIYFLHVYCTSFISIANMLFLSVYITIIVLLLYCCVY